MAVNETLQEFQQDLRDGMSINDACTKHNITFQEAVESLYHKPGPKRGRPYGSKTKKKGCGEKYIQARDGHFYLRKNVKKRTRMFGTYKTLEDAIKMREHCIKHGWKQHSIDRYCEELGIARCIHHNSTVRYH